MTVDMNVSRSAGEVLKKPIVSNTDNGVYLWLIIGCSLGGALLLTLIIAALVYMRRRRGYRKGSDHLINHSSYIPGAEFCPQQMISSFSSSSDDTSEAGSGTANGRQFRRPLGPSSSLDPPSLLRLTSECVQPKPVLTRWHTVASPQTTAILMDAERDSDEESTSRNPPCLHGRLWFALDYKPDLGQLDVILHKAKYLPGRGLINSPRDPFVKVYLLPDEETFHQSKIRKRTLSPKFHETFTFDVSPEDLIKRTLKLSVYDVDKRKVRHCLGHVLQPVEQLKQLRGEVICKDLEMAPQSNTCPGEIQLCLSCNPFSNRIKVTICRVRNLQDLPEKDVAVFVRVEMYHGRRLVKCKRTQAVAGGRSVSELVFDEPFGFGVSGRFFDSCSLGFVVVLEEENIQLGKVVIGPFMYARGDQLQHWQEMLSNPRNSITRWHPLENSSGRVKKS